MLKQLLSYISVIAIVACLSLIFGLFPWQVISVTVFTAIVMGSLLFWRFRLAFAFIGVVILLASGLLNIPHFLEYSHLDIILFLIGMMIVIGFLEERRFFEILLSKLLPRFKKAERLIVSMMLMSAFFAALVDEVTSILFMTSTMIHCASRYRVNPTPFVVMLVFATNIGSSATVVGNPVGVMIAFSADLTFSDFLRWATPISIISLLAMTPLIMWYFRREMKELSSNFEEVCMCGVCEKCVSRASENPPVPRREFLISLAFFLGVISLLVLHHHIEQLLGLPTNTMLLGTALGAGGLALALNRHKAREIVEVRVDWWTLSFFLLFFASVGTLKFTGVTSFLAIKILFTFGLETTSIFLPLTLISGFLSAFMDNVLAVATFIPIILDLKLIGISTFPLWWGVLFAGTFFGNLTMIGSTANIVAIGMMERRKIGSVTFTQWIKPGIIASVVPLTIAILLLYFQIPIMPWR